MLYPREGFNIPRWFASQLSRRQTLQKLTIQQNRQPALSVSHCRICRENNTACYSPAKPCNTVHSDAAARFLSKLGVEQLEPVVHNLGGRRGTIIEGPVLEETKKRLYEACVLWKGLTLSKKKLPLMCMCVNTYHNLYPFLLYWSLIIGCITHSHQCVHVKPLQLLERHQTRGF